MNLVPTAVLAIDLHNEYRSGATYPVEGYDGILANAAPVFAAARATAILILHAQAWVEDGARQTTACCTKHWPKSSGREWQAMSVTTSAAR